MSQRQSVGLSIGVFKPDIVADGANVTYTPRGANVDTLVPETWTHTTRAMGGYWSARFDIKGELSNLEKWHANRIGHHIELYDPELEIAWEGFINKVSLNVGGLAATRGPLIDIANRVSVRYAKQEIVGRNIVTTQSLTTTIDDNDDSKLAYGIFEKIISGGTILADTQANELRDSWLAEHNLPETSERFSGGAGAEPSVTVECLGYVHFLSSYFYTADTLNVDNISVPIYDPTNADSKLRTVLLADPNDLFTNEAAWYFFVNMILQAAWEDQDTVAYPLIETMMSMGDGSDNRTLFGVYADRVIKYEVAPTAFEYQQNLSDNKQRVRAMSGAEVKPWNVLPGKWLLFTDFLIGKTQPDTIREDQRALFIEQVSYTIPYGLQLDGNKVSTVKQKLAKMGLGVTG